MLRPERGLTPYFRDTPPTDEQGVGAPGQHLGSVAGLVDAQIQPLQAPFVAPRVRRGAVDGFIKTCERWGLTKSDQIALLGYAGDDLGAEQVLRNRIRASRDVIDRTGYVLGISIGLSALFNDSVADEVAWLNRAHPKLNNASPMEIMLQGKMISIINVFNLVSHERAL